MSAHRHTTTRLEAIDQEHQAALGRLDETARRLQAVERSLDPLTQATEAIPGVQHQLAVLKSLADHLAQKTTSLDKSFRWSQSTTTHRTSRPRGLDQ